MSEQQQGKPAAEAREVPAAAAAVVLQDWAPMAGCLDFQLGQLAFQRRGAQAFTTHEVPNLVNQGGLSAVRAAELLFASCADAEARGTLEADIVAVEMAIGLGVHAVQLLDRFRLRCQEAGRDWYQRLTFYATDVTPKMLADAHDRGVFARHEGRVVLGLLDARAPHHLRRLDDGATVDLSGRPRLVVHTYLLCVLGANVFRVRPEPAPASDAAPAALAAPSPAALRDAAWEVLVARTVLRHPEALPRFTTLGVAEVQAAATSREAAVAAGLVDLYPLLDLELSLAKVDPSSLPDLEGLSTTAAQLAAARPDRPADEPIWVLHSGGAMQSIERTLAALRPDGLLLYRDYGPSTADEADRMHLYQHYGPTTAIGINHFAIDRWLEGSKEGVQTLPAPDDATAMIKTRLVLRQPTDGGPGADVVAAFARLYSAESSAALEAAIDNARAQRSRSLAAAVEGYRHALRLEPANWALLAEAAEVALAAHAAGAAPIELVELLAREALRINPWSTPATFVVLGDARWRQGDIAGADEAYERATLANPESPRGWFARYLVARARADFVRAVEFAARAVAVDRDAANDEAAAAEGERLRAALRDAIDRLAEQRALAVSLRRQRAAGSHR